MKLAEWVQATYHFLQADVTGNRAADQLTQEQIQQILSAAIEALRAELYRGGQLHIQRLGILRTVTRRERIINDNFSGEPNSRRKIPARRSVRFQPSSALLAFLNNEADALVEEREIELPAPQPQNKKRAREQAQSLELEV